jgi:rRNA maturation endonuclease Nob1
MNADTKTAAHPQPACVHCGHIVWWSFPRPEDICWDCGNPIGIQETDRKTSVKKTVKKPRTRKAVTA